MAKHGIFVKKYGEEEDNLISELSSEMTGNYYEAFREAANEALAISQDDNNYFAEVYMVDDEGNIINDEEGPSFSTWDKDKEDMLMEKEESGRRLYEIDEEGEYTYAKKKEELESPNDDMPYTVVINCNLSYTVWAKTKEEAKEKAMEIEMPGAYEADTFEIVKVIEGDEGNKKIKSKDIKANEKFVVVVGIEVEANNEDEAKSKVSTILMPKQDNKEIIGYYIDYADTL